MQTAWGCWFQTMDEVFINVDVSTCKSSANEKEELEAFDVSTVPLAAKEVNCKISNTTLKLQIRGRTIIDVSRFPVTEGLS